MNETVLKNYQLKLDELNTLSESIEEWFEMPAVTAKQKFDECLFWFFVDGFSSGILMTTDIPSGGTATSNSGAGNVPSGGLSGGGMQYLPNGYEFLNVRYPDGMSVEDKFNEYYLEKDAESMRRLLESESHRMYNTGSLISTGFDIDPETGRPVSKGGAYQGKKTWITMMDDRVREAHAYLQGRTIDIDDEFVTIDGDSAFAPGLFSNPENNVNCRCILAYSRGN